MEELERLISRHGAACFEVGVTFQCGYSIGEPFSQVENREAQARQALLEYIAQNYERKEELREEGGTMKRPKKLKNELQAFSLFYESYALNRNNFDILVKEYNNLVEVVNSNERVLGTLISWMGRELGEHGVKQLLEMLNKEE